MKLRNKKTGEIGEFMGTYNAVPFIGIGIDYHDGNPVKYEYNTLTELNDEWEDYEPKEPLIKDEKIRKAVLAWAEAIEDDCLHIVNDYRIDDTRGYSIEFYNDSFENLEKRYYTIRELCGEEKECES